MSRSLRDIKRAATRRALATTTYEMVLARGLDEVTVDEITTAVQVSRRTFSNYFVNKEEAVAAVPVSLVEDELERWTAPDGADLLLGVRSFVGHMLGSEFPRMFVQMRRLTADHPQLRPYWRDAQWAVWDALGARLRTELRLEDPRDKRDLAMVMGALFGIVSSQLEHLQPAEDEPAALEEVGERIEQVLTWLQPALAGSGQAPSTASPSPRIRRR